MSYESNARDAKHKAHRIATSGDPVDAQQIQELAKALAKLAEAVLELGEELKKLKRRSSQ